MTFYLPLDLRLGHLGEEIRGGPNGGSVPE